MKHIELLLTVLEYIEVHLCDDMKTEDIAGACFCSRSTLEKLFRSVYSISVHGYIVRRRMMLAAKKLSEQPQLSILDIAVEYGTVHTNPLHVHLNRYGTVNLLNSAMRNSRSCFRGLLYPR